MSSAQEQRHSSTSSSSSSSSTSRTRSRRRTKWSREDLLKGLSILANLPAPPAPELPPSPPASRSNSPAPGSKRKATNVDSDRTKRPRTSTVPDRSSHHRLPPPTPSASHHARPSSAQFNLRSEPSEEGEVREESAVASSSHAAAPKSPTLPPATILSSTVPIRRPRRERPDTSYFDEMHRKYYEIGRAFKFSGDARFWSTYPAHHREYRPLPKPPPSNSPYHKFGGLIARLELMDALVCFTYSLWSKEYARRACFTDTWQTAAAFLTWCKTKWQSDTQGERETAFQGLILMIEGFIHARKVKFQARMESDNIGQLWQQTRSAMHSAAREEDLKSSSSLLSTGASHLTPQGLPSPANSAPTTSAHSTPTNLIDRAHEGGASSSRTLFPGASPNVPPQLPPFPVEFMAGGFPRASNGDRATEQMKLAASKVTVEVSPHMMNHLHNQTQWLLQAQTCLKASETTLNLPKLAKSFPVTFARMIHSSLGPDEEYQPDMEDEEGELYWPGQCISGEGLGWVCLMGKAMISELGKDIGYIGLQGVIPKPKAEAPSGSTRGQPPR